jgi:hypothetical protein
LCHSGRRPNLLPRIFHERQPPYFNVFSGTAGFQTQSAKQESSVFEFRGRRLLELLMLASMLLLMLSHVHGLQQAEHGTEQTKCTKAGNRRETPHSREN